MKKPVRRLSDWFFRPYHISYQKITGGYNKPLWVVFSRLIISYQRITGATTDSSFLEI